MIIAEVPTYNLVPGHSFKHINIYHPFAPDNIVFKLLGIDILSEPLAQLLTPSEYGRIKHLVTVHDGVQCAVQLVRVLELLIRQILKIILS